MESKDTYKTIAVASDEVLFKEKGSKFFGYAFPIQNEAEVKVLIEPLRKMHFGAVHFCYAYQIGTEKIIYRANDDGEPNNTAGTPIYGQIQSFDVTNVLVVVVRFFGGTKLGVGGLISAYKSTAQLALEQAEIVEKTINIHFQISFDYASMNKVMRILKEKNLVIINQKMETHCQIEIAVRKSIASKVPVFFEPLFEVKLTQLN